MKKTATILIIDHEQDIIFSLKMLLKQHYTHVYAENNPYHIPRLLNQYNPDVVLLDMNFKVSQTKGEEGIKWLTKIKELKPDLPVIMMTAYSDLDTAIQALHDQGMPNMLTLQRLKRQKLSLKDRIAQLEDRIIPDITA